MADAPDALELAQRLFDAIPRGDIEAVRAAYAPDAVIWHNNDGVKQSPEENLRTIAWVAKNIANLRYEEVQRQATPGGFVQQHVMRGNAPSGAPLEVPACIVCSVVDGRITRLDEYLDSAHLAPLRP